MKSTTGAHYLGLDHLRAIAALMVICWHFMHGYEGYPVPFSQQPAVFPLVLLDEGHVGVALFMVLSGYLFAKLLDGKRIVYLAFLWNRAIRLLPMLCVAMALGALQVYSRGDSVRHFAKLLLQGVVLPTIPNGGWSITVEAHFYIVLPVFLWLLRYSRWLPLAIVGAGLTVRSWLYLRGAPVEDYAYWTIIGRVDQLALGMMAFHSRHWFKQQHLALLLIGLAFCAVYYWFDSLGGWKLPRYPSKPGWWVILPTIEGLSFAALVAWYDTSFVWPKPSWAAKALGRAGELSYALYLLHFLVVFKFANFVQTKVMDISNFYVAIVWALVFYVLMMPLCALANRFIEMPPMRYRKVYTRASQPLASSSSQASATA